ncbi:MAG TPA: alkaline phosphatase family protein, partial [Puia sp.]|nr:alkaline phosphatase family protein [Puia sp.]
LFSCTALLTSAQSTASASRPSSTGASPASRKTENLVIVTLDGMRWQEIFGGIDSALLGNAAYTMDKDGLKNKFWSDDARERRKKLFPFLWTTVEQKGQLYGNRNIGNNVNVANRYKFSYPGYSEIFTGYPDTAVNSNDKILNKNINVLEYINKQKGYAGKVAVFSSWDVFPFILNRERSGIYINADNDTFRLASKELKMINEMQFLTARPLGLRPDLLTYFAGKEYLKAYNPRVLYIGWDETDDYAHAGLYDQYINSAHAEDGMLADLWNTLQSMPQYKDKTTLIVTCDHGRGDKIKAQWKDHGQNVDDSGQIWMVAMGPDTRPGGEISTQSQLYQQQWAPTMAALLGFDFRPAHSEAAPVRSVLL